MVKVRNDTTSCARTYEDTMIFGDLGFLVDLVNQAGANTLVKKNGCPTPLLLKLMWEILWEVSNLHDRGQAHGHLCPKSILIYMTGESRLGLYAKLRSGSPCLNSSKTGCDVSVWQAPEQRSKNTGHPTLSANIYSVGEIFYYCITGMRSKSDKWEPVSRKGERVAKKGERVPMLVACPAAKDLISLSWSEKPESRPKANELLNHPLFWMPEKRVSFLRDIIERPSDSKYSNLWNELQNLSVRRVTGGEWNKNIKDKNVLGYISEQKSNPEEEKTHEQNKKSEQKKNSDSKQNKKKACNYNFCSVRDLVRLIRNMKVHYRELPEVVQQSVGEPPKGFDSFFTSRFPNLLIEVYKVVREFCKEDEYFCRYFSLQANELLNRPWFWTPEKRVSFLRDVNERPSDSKYPNLWSELQRLSVDRVTGGKWHEKINDGNVLNYILKRKSNPEWPCNYDFSSVRDLVRLIRNMKVHYRELPDAVQQSVGEPPKGFDSFFTSRFPNLLIEVYEVVREFCEEDEYFCRYFSGDARVAD